MTVDGWIVIGLIALTIACYARVVHFGFVNFDDDRYLTANHDIQQGLSAGSLRYAFGFASQIGYWHPLAVLSHMLDVQLFGLNAGWMHAVNLAWHVAATLMLWRFLLDWTGLRWPSAWAAAMFAVHPMHVESVAWIAERKDVLSGFFIFLSLWAYLRYQRRRGWQTYAIVTLCLTAALLSKPMAVTTPALFLLLDLWPNREPWTWRRAGRLIAEKLPWFVMSAIVAVVTVLFTIAARSFHTSADLPWGMRLQTSIVSYARYLGKLVWPANMVVFYPYPERWPIARVAGSLALVVAITLLAAWQFRRRAYLLAGWLWFLIVLLPVIGLLASGDMSLADRYTYVPYVGLFAVIAIFAAEWPRRFTIALGAASVVLCAVLTILQVSVWRDSLSLWQHALRIDPQNWSADLNYACALCDAGREGEAGPYFSTAAQEKPRGQIVQVDLARYLLDRHDLTGAEQHLTIARQADPSDPQYLTVAGRWLAAAGQPRAAIEAFERALDRNPYSDEALAGLATALVDTGQFDAADRLLQSMTAADPNSAPAYHQLARIAAQRGQLEQALADFERAIDLDPRSSRTRLDFALLLIRTRQPMPALDQLGLALVALKDDDLLEHAKVEWTIGSAVESVRRPLEAAEHYQKSLDWLHQAIARRPDDARAHYVLAVELRQLAETDSSQAEAKRARELAIAADNQTVLADLAKNFPAVAATQPESHR